MWASPTYRWEMPLWQWLEPPVKRKTELQKRLTHFSFPRGNPAYWERETCTQITRIQGTCNNSCCYNNCIFQVKYGTMCSHWGLTTDTNVEGELCQKSRGLSSDRDTNRRAFKGQKKQPLKKKEQNAAISSNIDRLGGHYAKSDKHCMISKEKKHNISCMRNLKI